MKSENKKLIEEKIVQNDNNNVIHYNNSLEDEKKFIYGSLLLKNDMAKKAELIKRLEEINNNTA